MTAGSKLRLLALAVIGASACMGGAKDPATPTAKEQALLDAQFERVFAGVDQQSAATWEFDQHAVRELHKLAYWLHSYHALTGSYPLADRLGDELNFVQCFVYGDDSKIDYVNPVNQQNEQLFVELLRVLGNQVFLPTSADPSDWRGMHYSTSGRGFTVAVDLHHPVNGGEMVSADQCQYRIASYANATLPIHSIASILSGELKQLEAVRWRDPSLQHTR